MKDAQNQIIKSYKEFFSVRYRTLKLWQRDKGDIEMKKENIVAQYISLQKEIQEIKKDIRNRERQKEQLETSVRQDIVKGGSGGNQRYKISSFNKADIEESEYLINKGIRLLKEREKTAQETLVEIESFINKINDSRMRRMISLKYIHGKTWYQVAQAMGDQYTADSCKKQVQRFFRDIEK